MFKKRNVNKSKLLRRSHHQRSGFNAGDDSLSGDEKRVDEKINDDDEDDEDDTTAVTAAIQQTRKKRKLMESIQYKRGVDATQLIVPKKNEGASPEQGNTNNIHHSKTITTTTAVKTAAETSSDDALERKHRQAMEAFIESRMKTKDGKEQKVDDDDGNQQQSTQAQVLTEDALYMDLAAESAKLAGKEHLLAKDSGLVMVKNNDDDADDRGAIMVGGSGIAEVILPVAERLKVAQATQAAQAAKRQQQQQQKSSTRAGASFPSDKTDAGSTATMVPPPPAPVGIPNRFAIASHNWTQSDFDRNNTSNNNNNNNNSQPHGDATQATTTTTQGHDQYPGTAANEARPGFEALRQQQQQAQQGRPGGAHGTNRRDQASDHRVFTKFVTRQRELRK